MNVSELASSPSIANLGVSSFLVGPKQQETSNKVQFQESRDPTASPQQIGRPSKIPNVLVEEHFFAGSAQAELPQHSQQPVPLPQASPRKQKAAKGSPAVRSLSSSDARHKEENGREVVCNSLACTHDIIFYPAEHEPGTTMYLNGVPVRRERDTPKQTRHTFSRDRATSLSPGQGRKLPG